MQRFTISLDDKLAEAFDAWITERSYPNRSQAVRQFADQLCTQRGVRHGKLNLISVEMHQPHRHAPAAGSATPKKGSAAAVPHLHMRPAH